MNCLYVLLSVILSWNCLLIKLKDFDYNNSSFYSYNENILL